MSDSAGLELLIETESKLADRLAAAQAEAEAALASARQSVAEADARYEAELEAGTTALTTRLSQRRAAEVARLRAEAESSAARFEQLGPDPIESLVSEVVHRVLDTWRPVPRA